MDGLNFYAYCGGSPMDAVDPSGLQGSGSLSGGNTPSYANWMMNGGTAGTVEASFAADIDNNPSDARDHVDSYFSGDEADSIRAGIDAKMWGGSDLTGAEIISNAKNSAGSNANVSTSFEFQSPQEVVSENLLDGINKDDENQFTHEGDDGNEANSVGFGMNRLQTVESQIFTQAVIDVLYYGEARGVNSKTCRLTNMVNFISRQYTIVTGRPITLGIVQSLIDEERGDTITGNAKVRADGFPIDAWDNLGLPGEFRYVGDSTEMSQSDFMAGFNYYIDYKAEGTVSSWHYLGSGITKTYHDPYFGIESNSYPRAIDTEFYLKYVP